MNRIIIIGASSGIGRELARIFARNGDKIGIAARREELLESLLNECPEQLIAKRIDVCELETLPLKLEKLAEELGGLDILIYSSGRGELNPGLDFELEKPTLETNVLAFTSAIDWAYGKFEQQGHGHIVGITSIAALLGGAEAPAYGASKAFQANYLEALSNKAKKFNKTIGKANKNPGNISVTDIRPGFVDTEMAKGDCLFWIAPVEKAAKQIHTAIIRKSRIAYITKRWGLIGFFLRVLKIFG